MTIDTKARIRTAECVSPMHPDKMCDRISDSLLAFCLEADPDSRVAIETCGGMGMIHITGEVTSKAEITQEIAAEIVRSITGESPDICLNLNTQSPEIARGVDSGGAGDQGIMIGYACNENEQYLPQEYFLARELNKLLFEYYPYDGKTQVTMEGNSLHVVASFQNAPASELEELVRAMLAGWTIESLHCNPAGDWAIGGFDADAGVTGRKLAVDNYGPRVPIGGGAFSGKDPTKVDRSGAYMARRIAVELLQEHDAQEVTVELAYAIGLNQPLQATALIDGSMHMIENVWDLSPRGIIEYLDLKNTDYAKTAMYGHMGCGFSWL